MNIMPLESLSPKTVFIGSGEGAAEPLALTLLDDLLKENDRAQMKHGLPSPNPLRGITIQAEELGEAAEQALKLTSLNPTEHCNQPVRDRLLLLREEWVQIASVAIRQIQNIDNGRMLEWVMKNQLTQS